VLPSGVLTNKLMNGRQRLHYEELDIRQLGPRWVGFGSGSSASSSLNACINSSYVVLVVDESEVDGLIDVDDSAAAEVPIILCPSEPFSLSSIAGFIFNQHHHKATDLNSPAH